MHRVHERFPPAATASTRSMITRRDIQMPGAIDHNRCKPIPIVACMQQSSPVQLIECLNKYSPRVSIRNFRWKSTNHNVVPFCMSDQFCTSFEQKNQLPRGALPATRSLQSPRGFITDQGALFFSFILGGEGVCIPRPGAIEVSMVV